MTKKNLFCGFFPFSAPCETRLHNFYYFLKRLFYLHQTIKQELNRPWIRKPSIFKPNTSKRNAFPWWCIAEYNTYMMSTGFTQIRDGDLLRAESDPRTCSQTALQWEFSFCIMTGTMNYESYIYSIGYSIKRKTKCYGLLPSETFHVGVEVNW